MAFSALETALPLDECAQRIGANPALFNQSFVANLIGACGTDCSGLWVEWLWQVETGLSRDALAHQLLVAENEIASYLGRPLVPKRKRQFFDIRPDPNGCNLFTGMHLHLSEYLEDYWPYVPEELGTIALEDATAEDQDNDGFPETVAFAVTADTAVEPEALVAYVGGRFGVLGSQIRPVTDITHVDILGERTFTIRIPVWQLVKPELLYSRTFGNNAALDLTDGDIFVTSVAFGYMRQDKSSARARLYYSTPAVTCGNDGCAACTDTYVDADWRTDGARIWVYPAEYDPDDDSWTASSLLDCTCGRRPSSVEIVYYDGISPATPRSELSENLKEAVSLLAAARFTRVRCDCECGNAMQFRTLQRDLAMVEGAGRYTTAAKLNCPFGTRYGEQEAFNRIAAMTGGAGLVVKHGGF